MPRLRKRYVIAIVAAFALLAAAVADNWLANREMDQLTSAIETSETTMQSGNEGLAKALQDLQAVAARQPSELPAVYESERQAALAAIRAAAGSAAASVRAEGAEVSDVSVVPWHRDLQDAQKAYLDHSKAWAAYFRAVADDPTRLLDEAMKADISATWKIAESRLTDAVPWWDTSGSQARINDIFAAN